MKYVRETEEVHLLVVSDVKAGESLTVKYLDDDDYLLGVYHRRRTLHTSWLFWCDCARCMAELQETSTTEHLRCKTAGCKGFVHLPGPFVGTSTAVDPLVPRSRTCSLCKKDRGWEKEEEETVVASLERLRSLLMRGSVKLAEVIKVVQSCHAQLRSFVHEDHWTIRVVNYNFSLAACQIVGQYFDVLQRSAEGFEALIGDPLIVEGAEPEGGVTLHWMADLWQRIKTFYPTGQGWQLHISIIRCVVAGLTIHFTKTPPLLYSSSPFRPLSPAVAKEFLAVHVPGISPEERKGMFRVLQMKSGKDFGAKEQKELRQILS
jgi:hypothetical protein